MNIRDAEAVDKAVAGLVAKHGRLDGVVNAAGGQFPVAAGELKPKGWLAVVDTNLNGTWWVTQAAYRHALREGGGAGTHPLQRAGYLSRGDPAPEPERGAGDAGGAPRHGERGVCGFHLRAKLGGLYAREASDEE